MKKIFLVVVASIFFNSTFATDQKSDSCKNLDEIKSQELRTEIKKLCLALEASNNGNVGEIPDPIIIPKIPSESNVEKKQKWRRCSAICRAEKNQCLQRKVVFGSCFSDYRSCLKNCK